MTLVTVTADAATFEAASVRIDKPGTAGGEGRTGEKSEHSPASLTMTNVTLTRCIEWAWQVDAYQIARAPAWFSSDRYDIRATSGTPVDEAELRRMLQALLEDRFHLCVHPESKDLPLYALAPAKNGPKLQESRGDGAASMVPVGGRLVFRNVSMADLASRFAARPLNVDRPVIDKTGLNGAYDFALEFGANAAELKSSLESMDRGEAAGPSIFAALREQLGLQLEPRKGSVAILTVENAARPSEN